MELDKELFEKVYEEVHKELGLPEDGEEVAELELDGKEYGVVSLKYLELFPKLLVRLVERYLEKLED